VASLHQRAKIPIANREGGASAGERRIDCALQSQALQASGRETQQSGAR
jgi:hypothetical protein